MSKNMMKRSLVLGTLMAFVITGNALAAGDNNRNDEFSDSVTSWTIPALNGQTTSENALSEHNELKVINSASVEIGANNSFTYVGVTGRPCGTANNNTVFIEDNSVIKAGYLRVAEVVPTGTGTIAAVTENKLYVTDDARVVLNGAVPSSVVDISAENVIANDNKIYIDENAMVKGELYVVRSSLGSDTSGFSFTANENIVEICGNARVETVGGVYLTGSFATAGSNRFNSSIVSNGNQIKITGKARVETESGLYGVCIKPGTETTTENYNVNVENNHIIIEKDAYVKASKGIYGAYVQGSGTGSNVITVKNNSVTISGNAVVEEGTVVYGGYAEALAKKDVDGGYEITDNDDGTTSISSTTKALTGTAEKLSATATGNTVNITDNAVVKGEVYGGYASAFEGGTIKETNASENTINISGNADISGAILVGGMTEILDEKTKTIGGKVDSNEELVAGSEFSESTGGVNDDTSDENTSNNTLNISEDWTGGEGGKVINTVGNFDTIVLETIDVNNPIEIENLNLGKTTTDEEGNVVSAEGTSTAIVVNKLQLGTGVKEGEEVNVKLFNVIGESKGEVDTVNSKATIYVGTAEMGNASLDDLASGNATFTVKELDMNPQVLVIGESRAAATAFVNQGSELVETGLDALARDNAKVGDTKVFAAVYGNASEYATGSHVKVNGWSGIVGVGKTNDNGLTVGAFFENGDGNYRTYNVNAGTFMRGDGEAVYNGGGLLVRKDNANGVYTEASLRAGNLKNELKNAVMGKAGLDGYDVDTFYYGAHIGIGKVIPRGNEGDSIDIYGKFMYTHHDGETFDIQGDDYKFDSVDSERLRLGFRINEVQTNKLSMYYGAAWEYEFGGDADNKVVGYDLSTPSLEGSTMIGEIGMHYFASEKWSLDLNVRGYSGQRDGFTGSVQANYNF